MNDAITPVLIEFGKTTVRVPHRLRVQRRRAKGEPGMPKGAVYVGRPTILGNPFIHPEPLEAVKAYARLLTENSPSFQIGPGGLQFAANYNICCLEWWFQKEMLPGLLSQIRGKQLACWCPLDRPCHADVLAALANP